MIPALVFYLLSLTTHQTPQRRRDPGAADVRHAEKAEATLSLRPLLVVRLSRVAGPAAYLHSAYVVCGDTLQCVATHN